MDAMYAADADLKAAVPAAVRRHRAVGTLTWALIHKIEAEILEEVAATGKHSARMLGMLRASPAMGYPKDERPASWSRLGTSGTNCRLPLDISLPPIRNEMRQPEAGRNFPDISA
jgi:hypothetical protein